MAIDLRLGRWQDVLADVECDALITDPPYGSRTHKGHDAGVSRSTDWGESTARRRALSYAAWGADEVNEFVEHWHPRTRRWMAVMSCSDLAGVWREAFERVGRVAFAPIPCVIRAMSVRLSGDGPSNWAVYLNVARPRGWKPGTLNGAYIVNRDPGHIGGKPRGLMLQIVNDYSREGDLVCDPCAGYGTTLRAADALGRAAVGAEVDACTYRRALGRRDEGEDDGLQQGFGW